MSARQTLAIVEALLMDETVGLRARTESLAATLPNAPTGDPGPLSSDFTFYRGQLPGLRPANGGGNIMLRPMRWITNRRIGADVREGMSSIDIGFEYFGASPRDNVDEISLVSTALAQCLDGLRDFADAHITEFGAGIVDVAGMDWTFGDYEGATAYGFICRLSVEEYSVTD